MTKFTKGPWDMEWGEDSDFIHVGHIDERGIMPSAVVSLHDEANAALIAAAPELYEALELMLKYCEALENRALDNKVMISDLSERFERDPEDAAECALDKARGES